MVYFTGFFSIAEVTAMNNGKIINVAFERMWKQVAVVCCKVLSQNFAGRSEKN
jgi:hypothetical protein